jgi:hypothetical protein
VDTGFVNVGVLVGGAVAVEEGNQVGLMSTIIAVLTGSSPSTGAPLQAARNTKTTTLQRHDLNKNPCMYTFYSYTDKPPRAVGSIKDFASHTKKSIIKVL